LEQKEKGGGMRGIGKKRKSKRKRKNIVGQTGKKTREGSKKKERRGGGVFRLPG